MWGTTRAPRELGTAGIARLAEAAAHNKLCRMALHFAESIGRDMDFTLRAFGGPQSRISKWRMQRALCWRICTEMRFILCTWFGEFCSCCYLTALPGPAWVLLIWICKELISSLYRDEQKGLYVVARILFLLLLNYSAWPCLGPA